MSSSSMPNVWQIRQQNKNIPTTGAVSTLDDDEAWPEVQAASSMSSPAVNGVISGSPRKGEKLSSKPKAWTQIPVEELQAAADAHRERTRKSKSASSASSSSQNLQSASSSRTASPRNGKPRKLPPTTAPTTAESMTSDVTRPSPKSSLPPMPQPTSLPQQPYPQRYPTPPPQAFAYPLLPAPPYNPSGYGNFQPHLYASDSRNPNPLYNMPPPAAWNLSAPSFYPSRGHDSTNHWAGEWISSSALAFGTLECGQADTIGSKTLPLEIGVDAEAKLQREKAIEDRRKKCKRKGRWRGDAKKILREINGQEIIDLNDVFFWHDPSPQHHTQQPCYPYPYHVPLQPHPHHAYHPHHTPPPHPHSLPQYLQHQPPHHPMYYPPPHQPHYPYYQPPPLSYSYTTPYDQGPTYYGYQQPYGPINGDFHTNVSERLHESENLHGLKEDREPDTPLGIPNPTTVLLSPPSPSAAPHTDVPPPLSALPTLRDLRTFPRTTSAEGHAFRSSSHENTVEEAKVNGPGSDAASSTPSSNNTPPSTVNSSSLPTTSSTTPPITNSDTELDDQSFCVRNFGYGFGQSGIKPSGSAQDPVVDSGISTTMDNSVGYKSNSSQNSGQASPISSAAASPSVPIKVPSYASTFRGRSRGFRGRGGRGYYPNSNTFSDGPNDIPVLGQPSFRGRHQPRGRARVNHNTPFQPHHQPQPHYQQRNGLTTYIPAPVAPFHIDPSYAPSHYLHESSLIPGATRPYPDPITQAPASWHSVQHKLLGQLEFYMSKNNMAQDLYLRQQMSSEGWISLELLASFPRVKQLTLDVGLLEEVLQTSTVVELSEDGQFARMAHDWDKYIIRTGNGSAVTISHPDEGVKENVGIELQPDKGTIPTEAPALTPKPLVNGDAQPTPIATRVHGGSLPVPGSDEETYETEEEEDEDEEDDVVFVMGEDEDSNSGGWASSKSSSRQQSVVRTRA